MKFTTKFTHKTPNSLGYFIQERIKNASDYHDGAIESLAREVYVMTEILGAILDELPDTAQIRIAEQFSLEVVE